MLAINSEQITDDNLLKQIMNEFKVVPHLGFLEVDTVADFGSSAELIFIYIMFPPLRTNSALFRDRSNLAR